MFEKRKYLQFSLLSDGIPNWVTQIGSDGGGCGGGLGRSHSINGEDPLDSKFHRIRGEKSGCVSAMFLLFPKGSTISELIGEGDGPGVIAQASHGERRVKEVLKHRKGEKMDRRRVSGSGGANGRGNVKRPCGVVIECSSSMAIGKSEYEFPSYRFVSFPHFLYIYYYHKLIFALRIQNFANSILIYLNKSSTYSFNKNLNLASNINLVLNFQVKFSLN